MKGNSNFGVATGEHSLREFIIKNLQKIETVRGKEETVRQRDKNKNLVNSLKYMFSSSCSQHYTFVLSTSRKKHIQRKTFTNSK